MAIQFVGQLQSRIQGDGVTTTVSFDVVGEIVVSLEFSPIPIDRRNLPVAVLDASLDGNPGTATATLSGSILSVVFTNPPPAPPSISHTLIVNLLFVTP